ncbi:hypothetical protein NQ314_009119 [Rhamnusium bicolor]|uniref:Uncharacterized protein n=1 Tax=Rhamnusium bicolor TaxID=1586634 RepID=A0AAV8Y2Z4_9CUCU|nr:hypothetical protein NQ314_009119 [Rhamnusium bicolor]
MDDACGMSVCFLVEMIVRLYLTPPLLSLMTEKKCHRKEGWCRHGNWKIGSRETVELPSLYYGSQAIQKGPYVYCNFKYCNNGLYNVTLVLFIT